MKRFSLIIALCLLLLNSQQIAKAQIVTTSSKGKNPQSLILDVLKGEGVYIIDGKFNWSGDSIKTNQIGTFVNGDAFPEFPFKEGIILCTGDISIAEGPNNSGVSTLSCPQSTKDRDPDLQALNPNNTFVTTTVLEFDFMSTSSSFNFEYVFASEEYPEYVCSNFNDAFGFFLTGMDPVTHTITTKNIAVVPGSISADNPNGLSVAINTINPGEPGTGNSVSPEYCTSLDFSDYYVDNSNGAHMQFDGYTTALSAGADIVPCETYHMKLSIANAQDNAQESGVFIKASSFSSVDIDYIPHYDIEDQERLIEGCNDMNLEIKLGYPVDYDINIELKTSGTATEGLDYETLTKNLTLHAGNTSLMIPINVIDDNEFEGVETLILDVNIVFCGISSTHRMNFEIHELASKVEGSVCEDEPVHYKGDTYYKAGKYDYHYTTSFGCDSVNWLILENKNCSCSLWLPNAFTPNGDGINDVFVPKYSNSLINYEMYIYDRWGEQIFHSDNPDIGWDGNVKEKPVPNGAYYYVVKYTCTNSPNITQQKHGNITVFW